MKLKLIAAAIPALFMASSAFAVEGETSTVQFNGNIVEDTCTLANASKGQTVQLGDVSVNAFSGTGSTTQGTPFTIGLEGCNPEIATTAAISFAGETVGSGATALSTSDVGTTNVGIQILQAGTPLVLDGSATSVPQSLDSGTNSLNFTARYVAVADDVAAGQANGTANFTVSYE
ncbi:TPA: fimbrial protein [Escherichia coli]|nr:fimbrial protein [Escherichia coli]